MFQVRGRVGLKRSEYNLTASLSWPLTRNRTGVNWHKHELWNVFSLSNSWLLSITKKFEVRAPSRDFVHLRMEVSRQKTIVGADLLTHREQPRLLRRLSYIAGSLVNCQMKTFM